MATTKLVWRRPLERVISGGGPGAEQAGLHAARLCRIHTGGYTDAVPAGRGPVLRFGLRPHAGGAAERLRAHVLDSDATLRLGYGFAGVADEVSGRVLHALAAEFLDVDLRRGAPVQDVADWIVTRYVRTLHITGNQEPAAGARVFTASLAFLLELFRALGYTPDESEIELLSSRR